MRSVFLCFQENTDVIGVKYLDAVLRARGHESSILLIPDEKPENVRAAVQHVVAMGPDVLCFSAMSYDFPRARDFAVAIRERLGDRPIVFGGIHATADPESCLEVCDVVVRGEGEETLPELLQALPAAGGDRRELERVKGLVFKENGEVRRTPVRQPVSDLDALPVIGHLPASMSVLDRGRVKPVGDEAVVRKYVRYKGTVLSVISSRGCPLSCRYCCNSVLQTLYGDNRPRSRGVRGVIDEIAAEVRACGRFLYVNFQDDCFMMHSREWIEDFSRRYAETIGIPFIVRTTPEHVTRDKLVPLRRAGLRWVFMGLQTGSDRVNHEVYGRRITSEKFLRSARLVHELKLAPWYDVILDNPYETEADHLETIDLLLRLPRPFQLDLFSLDFFPGTELRERARRDGIPLPLLGDKSYTEPEPLMINRYIRMSPTLPRWLVRRLVRSRGNALGRLVGLAGYCLALLAEPFSYCGLIFRSRDYSLGATARTIVTFSGTAFDKLMLRRQG